MARLLLRDLVAAIQRLCARLRQALKPVWRPEQPQVRQIRLQPLP